MDKNKIAVFPTITIPEGIHVNAFGELDHFSIINENEECIGEVIKNPSGIWISTVNPDVLKSPLKFASRDFDDAVAMVAMIVSRQLGTENAKNNG